MKKRMRPTANPWPGLRETRVKRRVREEVRWVFGILVKYDFSCQ
jgi:hypothetical protein